MNNEEFAWIIRRQAIEMAHLSHGSHIGSILSVADIIAVLYNSITNINIDTYNSPFRDRIILSKGHAGAAIYIALAERGLLDKNILKTHYQNGSILSGHVSSKGIKGVELSTGSLGHGLSVGAGIAYDLKYIKKSNAKVYVILGDGECDEGSIWEAALFAQHFKLDNLIAVIDYNKMQSLDYCDNTLKLSPLKDKWESFNWNTIYVNDGNSCEQLSRAFIQCDQSNNQPHVIIASTIKGKGISFMESDILWHYRFPHSGGEYESAIKELEKSRPSDACKAPCEEDFL